MTESRIAFVPIVRRSEMDTSWPPLQRLDDVLVMNTSPLELTGAQPDARFVEALRSSATAWEVPGATDLIDPRATTPPPAEERAASLLAVYGEGTLHQLLRRSHPAGAAGRRGRRRGAGGGRCLRAMRCRPRRRWCRRARRERGLFVIGTSTILGNGFIEAGQQNPNTMLIHNLIDYLSGQEDRAALRGRGGLVRRLGTFSTDIQSAVKTFLIAGPPALVALAGAALWLWLRLRQRGIQARLGPVAAGARTGGSSS